MRIFILAFMMLLGLPCAALAFRPMPEAEAAKPPIRLSIIDKAGVDGAKQSGAVLKNPIKILRLDGFIVGGSRHPFQPPMEAQIIVLIDEEYDVVAAGPPYAGLKDPAHLRKLEKGQVTIELPKGSHSIHAVAVDPQGMPYAARMVSTITKVSIE